MDSPKIRCRVGNMRNMHLHFRAHFILAADNSLSTSSSTPSSSRGRTDTAGDLMSVSKRYQRRRERPEAPREEDDLPCIASGSRYEVFQPEVDSRDDDEIDIGDADSFSPSSSSSSSGCTKTCGWTAESSDTSAKSILWCGRPSFTCYRMYVRSRAQLLNQRVASYGSE